MQPSLRLSYGVLAGLCICMLAATAWAIIHGTECPDSRYADAVYIWEASHESSNYKCSGVLIAPDVVLTAASCLGKQEKSDVLLISNNPNPNFKVPISELLKSATPAVKHIERHPEEDLAILFLNQTSEIKPAIFITEAEASQIGTGKSLWIVGYGKTDAEGFGIWDSFTHRGLAGSKRRARANIVDMDEHFLILSKSEQSPEVCEGDIGGPAYLTLYNTEFGHKHRVIGIVVKNNSNTFCQSPIKVLRLDTLRQYINEILNNAYHNGVRKSEASVPGIIPPQHCDEIIFDDASTQTSGDLSSEKATETIPPTVEEIPQAVLNKSPFHATNQSFGQENNQPPPHISVVGCGCSSLPKK